MESLAEKSPTAWRHYKWFLVGFLILTGGLNYGDRGALTAVFPLLRDELGMSDVGLAAIGSVFLWSYAIVSPFAGYLGDRFSRRRVIVWSVTAWSAVTALTAWVASSNQLLAMRVLLGISESLYLPAALALISIHHSPRTRATAMALHSGGYTLGIVLAGTFTGYVGDHYGWRPALVLLGGVGIILAVSGRFALSDRPHEVSQPVMQTPSPPLGQVIWTILRIPSFVVVLVGEMLMAVCVWIFINWLPLYFKEQFNLSLASAGFAGTFFNQGGAFFGLLLGGYISDRLARRAAKHRMLLMAVFYFLAAPFLLPFLWSASYRLIAVSFLAFAVVRSIGLVNGTPLICDLLPAQIRSTALGFANMVNCFAAGLGVLVAGFLKGHFGLGGIFAGTSLILLLSSVVLFIAYFTVLERDLKRSTIREVAVNLERPSDRGQAGTNSV